MKPPAYARQLLDARRRGLRPKPPFDVVFVTDDWELAKRIQEWDFFALVCDPPSAPYDFLCLYDLPVVVLFVTEDKLGACERIARAQPRSLDVPSKPWLRYWVRITGDRPREDLASMGAA